MPWVLWCSLLLLSWTCSRGHGFTLWHKLLSNCFCTGLPIHTVYTWKMFDSYLIYTYMLFVYALAVSWLFFIYLQLVVCSVTPLKFNVDWQQSGVFAVQNVGIAQTVFTLVFSMVGILTSCPCHIDKCQSTSVIVLRSLMVCSVVNKHLTLEAKDSKFVSKGTPRTEAKDNNTGCLCCCISYENVKLSDPVQFANSISGTNGSQECDMSKVAEVDNSAHHGLWLTRALNLMLQAQVLASVTHWHSFQFQTWWNLEVQCCSLGSKATGGKCCIKILFKCHNKIFCWF